MIFEFKWLTFLKTLQTSWAESIFAAVVVPAAAAAVVVGVVGAVVVKVSFVDCDFAKGLAIEGFEDDFDMASFFGTDETVSGTNNFFIENAIFSLHARISLKFVNSVFLFTSKRKPFDWTSSSGFRNPLNCVWIIYGEKWKNIQSI